MFTKFDKAFAAIITSFLSALALHFFNWNISPEIQALIVTTITGFFTWLVPNKKPALPPA